MSVLAHETVIIERTVRTRPSRAFMPPMSIHCARQMGRAVRYCCPVLRHYQLQSRRLRPVSVRRQERPKYQGEVRYLHIESERQYIYIETIDADGSRLSASAQHNRIQLGGPENKPQVDG